MTILSGIMAADCKHCHVRRGLRGHRGLCQVCYGDLEIRNQYPRGGGRLREDDRYIVAPPLPEPTTALPGSEEKLCVLQARASAWLCLWHPRDAVSDPESDAMLMHSLLANGRQ